MPSAVTVSVTVNRDGVTSSETVLVSSTTFVSENPSRQYKATRATLSVSRTSTTQTVAITVNENASYYICRPHAGVSFTGVYQRVDPRPPQVHPPAADPPPPASTTTLWGPVSDLSAAEQAVIAETIGDRPPRPGPPANPTNPDGTVNLYGPGGLLTPERRQAWLCWSTFGNADGC